MQKKLLLFTFFTTYILFTAISAQAQWSVGVEAGVTRNYLYTDLGYSSFISNKPATGFTVGVPVHYQFNNWLGLRTDLSYMRKSYTLERSEYFAGTYQTTSNTYLKLPVMANFSFGGKKLKGFVNLGAYAAYWLRSNIKGVQASLHMIDPAGVLPEKAILPLMI